MVKNHQELKKLLEPAEFSTLPEAGMEVTAIGCWPNKTDSDKNKNRLNIICFNTLIRINEMISYQI